nr:unnamed protein product [Digitaria exilis]
MATSYFLIVVFLALASSQAIASDPSPQQDFCVGDKDSPVKVNGFICKDPRHVTADDFFKAADLDKPRNTKGKVGSNRHAARWPQHSRHFFGPHRLCALRREPATHAPTCY